MRVRPGDDAGVTLTELLIACAIVPIVLAAAGALVVSSLRTDASVTDTTKAASTTQLVSASITTAARQADWMSVSNSGTGQLLQMRSASAATTLSWTCRAWWIDGGRLYQKDSPSRITAPGANTTGWSLVASGVAANGTAPMFVYSAGSLAVNFTVSAGSQKPILVSTVVSPRNTPGTSTQCIV